MANKWSIGALALLWAGGALAAGPAALDLAPPDTALAIGVNVEGIKASKLGQSLTPMFREQTKALSGAMGAQVMEMLDGVREVVIVTTGASLHEDEKSRRAGRPHRRAGLALASGSFTAAGLAALAKTGGATPSDILGVTVYTRKEGAQDPVSLAMLSDSLLAIGDPASVRACVARRGRPAGVEPALRARASELGGKYHIWIATSATLVGDLAAKEKGQAANSPAAMLTAVRQISGGLKFGQTFQLDLILDTKSPQDAVSLRDTLNMFVAMGLANSGGKQLGPLLQNVKLQAKDNSVTLAISASEEDLIKSFQGFPRAQKPATSSQEVEVLQSAPPQPEDRSEPEPGSPASGVVTLPGPK
jgi:hypothetical protein